MNDLKTERSLDLQAKWAIDVLFFTFKLHRCVNRFLQMCKSAIDVLGLFFDKGVCLARLWQTSGRLVKELNVCTIELFSGSV